MKINPAPFFRRTLHLQSRFWGFKRCWINWAKGFTLVELLIVIAVVGVLSAGVITSINIVSKINSANIAKSETFDASIQNNLSIDLVGEWTFSGNTNDTSGYGNNGTVNGAVLTADRKGQSNKAYDFDGTDDIIQTANGISVFDIATELTFAAWFYVDTGNSSWQRPFQKFQNVSDGNGIPYGIHYGNAVEKWGCEYRNATETESPFIQSSSTYSSGSWYHVACVASKTSATEFVLYVNGVAVGSRNTWFTSGDIDTGPRPITIGGARNAGTHWNGKIDDVRIYKQALSLSQVQQLYAQGLIKHLLAFK